MITTREALAATIDQTLLKPTAGAAAAAEWARAMRDQGFATLCVSPSLVPAVGEALAGAATRLCSVVGFPFGNALTQTKVAEAAQLVALGCREIDMVMAIGALLEGDDRFVRADVAAVVESVRSASGGSALVKVIIETGHLHSSLIETASVIAVESGASYVKTSSGFGPRGASIDDVRTIRDVVGPEVGVKAAGGIRDLDTALEMLEAGASRIGTSSGLEILEQFSARQG